MRWLDSPPIVSLDVKSSEPHRLVLSGPRSSERVASGFMAAFGGVFTTMAVRFLRTVPPPMRAIPLVLTAVGAGMTAVGAASASSSCTIEFVRDRGVTLRWRVPPLSERTLEVPLDSIEAFEVTHHHRVSDDKWGNSSTSTWHHLELIKRDGAAIGLEKFATKTQAALRQKAVEAVLNERTV